MKKLFKTKNGITLIALIITIIVLLILAGVTIATLTGEHGILTQAEEAKKNTTKAELMEKIQLEMLASIDEKGKYNVATAKTNLRDNLGITDISENNGTLTIKENGYEFFVDAEGVVSDLNASGGNAVTFNPETLEIGDAINTDKYGYKVGDYTVAYNASPSGVWRLYYQDSKYTYLIADSLYEAGGYSLDDYKNGASVSTIGQKLNPKIGSLFTESNTNYNIIWTAMLTDTSDEGPWASLKNEDAVFAIGSPTVELFAASFNSTNPEVAVQVESDVNGYKTVSGGSSVGVSYKNGIFNRGYKWLYWFASPSHGTIVTGPFMSAGISVMKCFDRWT